MTRPLNGVRFELLLTSNDAGTARYEGHAYLPKASVAIAIATTAAAADTALGAADGEALSASERAVIEKLCTALVRAATRALLSKGEPVPQKIVRWRPLD